MTKGFEKLGGQNSDTASRGDSEDVVESTPEQVILKQDSIGDNGKPLRRGAGKKEGKGNKKASDTTDGKKSKRTQAPEKSEVSIAEPIAEPEIELVGHADEALQTEAIEEETAPADKEAVETAETEKFRMPFTQMTEIIDAFETSEVALSERDGYLNEFVVFDENDGGKIIPKAEVEQLFNEKIAELRASEQKRGVEEKKTEVEKGVPREATNTESTPLSITEESAESTSESTARPTSANSERDAAESSLSGRLAELQPRDLYGNFQTIVDKAVRSLESLEDIKEFGQKIRSGEFTFYRSEENQKHKETRYAKGGLIPITENIDFDQLEEVDPQECIDYIDEHIAMTLRGKLEDVLDELAENDHKQIDAIEDKYLARLRYFFSDLPDDDEIKIGLENDIRQICMEKRSGATKHADNSPREGVAVKRKVNGEVVEIAQSSREDFSTRVYKIHNLQKLIDIRNQVEELYGEDILNNDQARDKYSIIHGCIRAVFRNRVENDLKKVHDIQALSEEFNRIKERYDRLFAEDITGGLLDDATKQGREDIKALIETRRGEIQAKVAQKQKVPAEAQKGEKTANQSKKADATKTEQVVKPIETNLAPEEVVKLEYEDFVRYMDNVQASYDIFAIRRRLYVDCYQKNIKDEYSSRKSLIAKKRGANLLIEDIKTELAGIHSASDFGSAEDFKSWINNIIDSQFKSFTFSLNSEEESRIEEKVTKEALRLFEEKRSQLLKQGKSGRVTFVKDTAGFGNTSNFTLKIDKDEPLIAKPEINTTSRTVGITELNQILHRGTPKPGANEGAATEVESEPENEDEAEDSGPNKNTISKSLPVNDRIAKIDAAKKELEVAASHEPTDSSEDTPNLLQTKRSLRPMKKTISKIRLKDNLPRREVTIDGNEDVDIGTDEETSPRTPEPIPTPEPRRPKIIPLPSSNSPYENKSPAAKLVKKAKGGFRRFLSRFGINF